MKKIVLIGAGGHSRVVQDIINTLGYSIMAVIDDKYGEVNEIDGIKYGPTSLVKEIKYNGEDVSLVIAIGSNIIRKRIFTELDLPAEYYVTLIHPTAIIGSNVEIGFGTVVMPNAVINANSVIGNHCIINSAAVIEHDNVVDSYVHISPKAGLAGNVNVMEGAHLGIGANVIPGVNIGSWSVIGAGATVIQNIPNSVVAVGVPAKVVKKLDVKEGNNE